MFKVNSKVTRMTPHVWQCTEYGTLPPLGTFILSTLFSNNCQHVSSSWHFKFSDVIKELVMIIGYHQIKL